MNSVSSTFSFSFSVMSLIALVVIQLRRTADYLSKATVCFNKTRK